MTQTIPALHIAGYEVYDVDSEETIGLAFRLIDDEGNEVQHTAPFSEWPNVASNYPIRARERMLAEALCRYHNTGADVKVAGFMDEHLEELPQLNIDPDWQLWSTTPDGEHVFVNQAGDTYYRVVEGQFTESMTASEFEEWKTGRKILDD